MNVFTFFHHDEENEDSSDDVIRTHRRAGKSETLTETVLVLAVTFTSKASFA